MVEDGGTSVVGPWQELSLKSQAPSPPPQHSNQISHCASDLEHPLRVRWRFARGPATPTMESFIAVVTPIQYMPPSHSTPTFLRRWACSKPPSDPYDRIPKVQSPPPCSSHHCAYLAAAVKAICVRTTDNPAQENPTSSDGGKAGLERLPDGPPLEEPAQRCD